MNPIRQRERPLGPAGNVSLHETVISIKVLQSIHAFHNRRIRNFSEFGLYRHKLPSMFDKQVHFGPLSGAPEPQRQVFAFVNAWSSKAYGRPH